MTNADQSGAAPNDLVRLAFTTNVPRAFFTVEAPLPATVTQHSVYEHFGVPGSDYMRMARAAAFPTSRIGRLRVARYEVLLDYLTAGARAAVRYRGSVPHASTEEKPSDKKPQVDPNARTDAERWLASSRTFADYRTRREEIARDGWALQEKYGPTLWDLDADHARGPNPDYDKQLYEQGIDLYLAASSITWSALRRRLLESGELVVTKPKNVKKPNRSG